MLFFHQKYWILKAPNFYGLKKLEWQTNRKLSVLGEHIWSTNGYRVWKKVFSNRGGDNFSNRTLSTSSNKVEVRTQRFINTNKYFGKRNPIFYSLQNKTLKRLVILQQLNDFWVHKEQVKIKMIWLECRWMWTKDDHWCRGNSNSYV